MPKHTVSERRKNRARATNTNRKSSGGAMMKVSSQDPNVNEPGAMPLMPSTPNRKKQERKL